ncbi:MAG: hypothetical protein QOE56_1952 [Solirubrobacterales bacterium]|jgi:hypothetical protein|nr:hypothetical protein [Solirubrobacterales bacterium]
MNWSPEGYVLRAPIWAQERPLDESRSELREAIDGALGEFAVVSVSVSPMEVTHSDTGADSDPGVLAITTLRMISPEAAGALRESVSKVLTDAVDEADRGEKADQAAWESVKQALQQKLA